MARRVGFGNRSNESEDHLRQQRTEREAEAQTDEPPANPFAHAPIDEPTPPLSRLIAGAFLMLWLVLWAAGVLFAIGLVPEMWGEGETVGAGFLILFVAIGGFGWWIGVRTFLKIIRGEPIRIRNRARPAGRPPMQVREPDDHGGDV